MRNLRVDFGAGQILDDQANITTFANSIGDFQTALNAALGADGSATFRRRLARDYRPTLGQPASSITDDPTNPATRGGRGFSHAFGLNDLVSHGSPLNYATGLSGADLHGFTAGQTVTFAVRDHDGSIMRRDRRSRSARERRSPRCALTSMPRWRAMARPSLDANGRLSLVTTNGNVGRIDVIDDTTSRGDTNLSMSGMFRLRRVAAGRALAQAGYPQRHPVATPTCSAAAQADLAGAAAGARVLSPGDGRGALAIEAAGTTAADVCDARAR